MKALDVLSVRDAIALKYALARQRGIGEHGVESSPAELARAGFEYADEFIALSQGQWAERIRRDAHASESEPSRAAAIGRPRS